MLSWTLVNEFGDRIERSSNNYWTAKKTFSYWGMVNGTRVTGHLNKIKKAVNEFRKTKTKWTEIWE